MNFGSCQTDISTVQNCQIKGDDSEASRDRGVEALPKPLRESPTRDEEV